MHFNLNFPERVIAKSAPQATPKRPVIEVDYFAEDPSAVIAAECSRRERLGEDMSNFVAKHVVAEADKAVVAEIEAELSEWSRTKKPDDWRSFFDVLTELKRKKRSA